MSYTASQPNFWLHDQIIFQVVSKMSVFMEWISFGLVSKIAGFMEWISSSYFANYILIWPSELPVLNLAIFKKWRNMNKNPNILLFTPLHLIVHRIVFGKNNTFSKECLLTVIQWHGNLFQSICFERINLAPKWSRCFNLHSEWAKFKKQRLIRLNPIYQLSRHSTKF